MIATCRQLFSEQEWARLEEQLGLPPRQAEITKHIVYGQSDKQIARDLGITIPTVRTHVGRLFRRLGLNDRKELILHVFACLREYGETPALATGEQSP